MLLKNDLLVKKMQLEIRSFVMNFNSGGFSLRIPYCVVDTVFGLGGYLGDCRPALPKGRKYQMVRNSLNKPMADLGFLFL